MNKYNFGRLVPCDFCGRTNEKLYYCEDLTTKFWYNCCESCKEVLEHEE